MGGERLAHAGGSPAHDSAIRFGGPHVPRRGVAAGVVFPGRCVSAVPLAPLSPPSRSTPRSRAACPHGGRRGRLLRVRVSECHVGGRPGVPSVEREPSPRDALSSARLRPGTDAAVWPPRRRPSTTFDPTEALRPGRARPPFTRPLPAAALLLGLGVARRLLQPMTTRGHTLRAIDPRTRVGLRGPAARRHQPMPVASARPMRRRIEGLRATPCTRRLAHDAFHLRGRSRARVEAPERRQRALWDDVARALLLLRPGHPGHPVPCAAEPGEHRITTRGSRSARRRRLAKGVVAGRIEVPSAASESLRERRVASPCAPGPESRYAASAEALLRASRAFFPSSTAPALTRQAPENGSTRRASGAEAPLARCVAAPVAASTTDSASRADVPRTSCSFLPTTRPHWQRKSVVTIAFFAHSSPTHCPQDCPQLVPEEGNSRANLALCPHVRVWRRCESGALFSRCSLFGVAREQEYLKCHVVLIRRFEMCICLPRGSALQRTRQRGAGAGAPNVPSAPGASDAPRGAAGAGCDMGAPPRDASASAPPARAPKTAAIHVAMTNRRDEGTRMTCAPRNAWTAPARPEADYG
jgi:hypothetical protein